LKKKLATPRALRLDPTLARQTSLSSVQKKIKKIEKKACQVSESLINAS
jgi:hypothetical protein